jgi:HAD superfamily hydrolase (TIGR01549 family)
MANYLDNKITGIKLVSVDLFRTLVDLDPTPKIIWEVFLKDNFSPGVAQKHWQRAAGILDRIWDEAGAGEGSFKDVRVVLEQTCSELFQQIQLGHELQSAVDLLMQKHRINRLFDDARPFLERVGLTYPVCLSTDCDLEMLDGIDALYTFKDIFVSESLEAYKLNPKFFTHIIRHYNLNPQEILHIGDSKSDIISPARLGVRTCWLNRTSRPWAHAVKPDFEVQSLMQVLDLLGIDPATATP